MTSELLHTDHIPEQFARLLVPLEELLLKKWCTMLPIQVLILDLLEGGDFPAILQIEGKLLGKHVPCEHAYMLDIRVHCTISHVNKLPIQ